MVDAKLFRAALYQSVSLIGARDYEDRSMSILGDLTQCNKLTMSGKRLMLSILVAREGVEPPTPAFSGLRTTGLSLLVFNNLTLQSGPSFVTIL